VRAAAIAPQAGQAAVLAPREGLPGPGPVHQALSATAGPTGAALFRIPPHSIRLDRTTPESTRDLHWQPSDWRQIAFASDRARRSRLLRLRLLLPGQGLPRVAEDPMGKRAAEALHQQLLARPVPSAPRTCSRRKLLRTTSVGKGLRARGCFRSCSIIATDYAMKPESGFSSSRPNGHPLHKTLTLRRLRFENFFGTD